MITINGGGTMHTVRPDRVYKTGVVTPTGGGYSPDANAYEVAQRFAASDQLQGGLSRWQKLKHWMKSRPAPRGVATSAPAQRSAPNAIVTNPHSPRSPGATLPESTATPGYPGQSPDATQMSAMGLYISSGFHPSFVPSVVQGAQERAAKLDPRLASKPAMLAYQATNYADGRVGQAAWQSAVRRFYAMNKSRIG